MILYIIYILIGVFIAYNAGRSIYVDDGPRSYGEVRAGNPRSAVLAGAICGAMWPVILCIVLLHAFVSWVEAGGKR